MCGLVAVITKNRNGFSQKQCEIFSNLLLVDSLRGDDSTGVFVVSNNGDLDLAKEIGHSARFLMTKEASELETTAFRRGVAMVGHNRKATKGKITDDNAHPFVVDNNIVLVHNGTLWGDHKKLADVEVDSHAIAHLIHENKGDMEKVVEQISGAWALIWYDFANQELHILRNNERPLCFLETSNEWVFASEANMLHWMVKRHNLVPNEKGIIELIPNLHTTFKWTEKGWDVTDKKITNTKSQTTHYQGGYYDSGWSFQNQNRRHGHYPYSNIHDDESVYYPDRNTQQSWMNRQPPALSGPHRGVDFKQYASQNTIEEKLAFKQGAIFQASDSAKLDLAVQEKRLIKLEEMIFANGKDNTSGYIVYGFFIDEPDVLARCYVDSNYKEERLMDEVLSGYMARVTVSSITYRTYQLKDHTPTTDITDPGYFMCFCHSLIMVETEKVV